MKDLAITVDTREQLPFAFASVRARATTPVIVRGTLRTGDYACSALLAMPTAQQAVVERKSLADLFGSVSAGRKRFEREMQRMSEFGHAAVIIESDWVDIIRPSNLLRYTHVSPRSVIQTIVAWSQRYKVHFIPCPGRRFAEQLTYRILERWFLDTEVHYGQIDAAAATD